MFEIKDRFTERVIYSSDKATTVREAVIEAVANDANLSGATLSGANLSGANLYGATLSGADLSGADLSGADLSGADLSGADLSGATLSDADLYGANLSGADLSGATLSGADLSGADLSGADLSGADLSGADLSGATLSDADLYGANLSGADLSGATLSGADLSGATLLPIKSDFFEVLLNAPHEVAGLKQALLAGEVDGSTYEGPCCCLVGTLAKVRDCNYNDLIGIKPNSDRAAERWFMGIRKGDKPETNAVAKITLEWIEEFEAKMAAANGVFPAAYATKGGAQ